MESMISHEERNCKTTVRKTILGRIANRMVSIYWELYYAWNGRKDKSFVAGKRACHGVVNETH